MSENLKDGISESENLQEKIKVFESVSKMDFNTYYNKYLPKLIYYCNKFVKDDELAFDYAQESIITALEKIDSYDVNRGAEIHTWIYTIARNHTLQKIKKSQKLPTVSMDVKFDDDGNTIKSFLCDDTERKIESKNLENLNELKVDIILKCMDKLKDPHKRVINMREIQNLSYKDISEKMGEEVIFKFSSNGSREQKLPNELSKVIEIENINGEPLDINEYYIWTKNGKTTQFYDMISMPKGQYIIKGWSPLNLSTVKSQIRNSRLKLQEMVKSDFEKLNRMYL